MQYVTVRGEDILTIALHVGFRNQNVVVMFLFLSYSYFFLFELFFYSQLFWHTHKANLLFFYISFIAFQNEMFTIMVTA